jgi:hypothetical protein
MTHIIMIQLSMWKIYIHIYIFQNILKEVYKTGESRLRLLATTINYAMFICLFGC